MTRISHSTSRLALAALIAGVGSLGLHASEPLRGFDPGRRTPAAEAPVAHAPAIRDRHMLRVTLTDGHSLLSGVTVTSGPRSAVTDDSGFAMLRVDGWPHVPVSFQDGEGQTIAGAILLPETPAEGVDALVFIDGASGTFETVAAGERGPERAGLDAAWADLEAYWLSVGIKEARPVATTFGDGPALALPGAGTVTAPGTNGDVAASSLQFIGQELRQDREDILVGGRVATTGIRRHESRLRGADARATGIVAPVNEFHKRGLEVLAENGLIVDEELSPKAGLAFGELVDALVLDDEAFLAAGAELLRQGIALDPILEDEVRIAMADAGISLSQSTLSAGSLGGQVNVPGLPGDAPSVMTIDSFEPDNSPAACGTIATDGTPQDRGLDPAGDLDYICFTAACGDTLHIETGLGLATTGTDTVIDLLDPSGNLIASDDDGAATSLWSMLDLKVDVAGTYTLRVRGLSASTVVQNYRVWVIATTGACVPLDASEPNNSQATCSPKVADGTYTNHVLRPRGDEDWHCFSVATCGSTVTLDINEPGDIDIIARMELFSPSGVQLLNTTSTVAQNVVVSETGTFAVRISGGGTASADPYDNGADSNTGDYALSVSIAGPTLPCDAFEPDSVKAQCTPIAGDGVPVPGHSISPVGDEDWYCVTVGCNDTISATVTPTPAGASTSLRPRIELWDPIATTAVTGTSAGTNGAAATVTRAANHAGTWYIRVLRASTATGAVQTGTYNIAVTTTPVPSANCDAFEADSDASQCRPPIDFAGTRESGRTLFPARDADWICLGNLACGDTIQVRTWPTAPANTPVDTVVELYKLPNTTTTVATNDEGGTGITPFSLLTYVVNTPANAGAYVAKIRHFSSTSTAQNPYDVSVLKTSDDCPEPDAFEPDNSSSECTPLPAGPFAGHNIFPGTDADFYCVNFACGDNLDVTVTPTGGSLRPIVALLNPAGTVIQTITSPANGSPVTLSTTDNNAGPHFIRVTSSSSTTGNYLISSATSAGTCLNDPFEPDDTSATCRFTGLPRTESRAINPATDSDYYCVNLDCGQGVNVTVTPTNGTLRAIVRLREQDGTTLTTVTATAAGEPVTLSRAVSAPGIYTIEVDSSTSTKGLYDIEMSAFDGFNCIDAYEPDNTRDACQPIATDGTIQDHTLLFHPDEDWVCFEITECGSRITAGTIQAIPMYDDADTTVELYGPSGNLLQSATTGGPASHGRLTRIVNDPGTYYVRVIPASTAATSTSGGQYGLQVTVEDVKAELIVPPVGQTLLPAHTQLDAEALTPSTGDYTMIVGSDPFIDISATGTHIDTGLTSIVVPIGFDFEYFGNSYANTAIHDNGILSFSDPTWIAGIGNECIPNATTPNEFIAAFWEDLDGDDTYYETIGTAPNRMFIAQWNDGYFPVTLQAILFEGTNEISLRYGSMLGAGSDGTSATIGIEDLNGDGIQYSCNTSAIFSGMSVSFVPAGPELVAYPNNPTCFPMPSYYEVTADTAPLIDISATGTDLGTPTAFTDDSFRTHALPITFPFYGNFETVINVASNGFANFGTGSTALTNQCPLTSAAPLGLLAPFWDDMNPATGGQILGQLFGVPGSGSAYYVIQWNQVPFFSVGGQNTFQIVLYETGVFEYRYGAMTATTRGSGDSATIGIKDRTGTNTLTYGCNTAGMVFEGLRLTFSVAAPPEPFQRFTWLDPATMDVLGTGPTYLHPIEGPCEVLLRVAVRDPIACCDIVTEQLVTVPDRFGPVFSSQPAFGVDGCQFLWPPNHGYADFSLASAGALASDNCGGVTFRFSALSNSSQQEDSNGNGDGGSVDDIMISPDGQVVSVRAERNGACDQLDRKYELFIEAVDDAGNVTLSAPFSVCVYHDQGHNPPGPYRSAENGSDSDDSRPGWIEGGYGTGCGTGCSFACDPTQFN